MAKEIGITEAKAYSVASFYENFSFEEKGKYIIKICDGTACHVRKSMPILDYLYKTLKLNAKKHTTEDALFTVETVSCLGACGLAPAITVNEKVYPKMSPEKMKKLLEEINSKGTTVIVVTHNLEIVKVMKKRVITVKKGTIVSDSKEGGYDDEN